MTAAILFYNHPIISSNRLQANLEQIQTWLTIWWLRVIGVESIKVTFTNQRRNCPLLSLNGKVLQQLDDINTWGGGRYGMYQITLYLDIRIWWAHDSKEEWNKILHLTCWRDFNTNIYVCICVLMFLRSHVVY